MTYSESARGITISRKRAFQEIQCHGITADMEEYSDFNAWLNGREAVDAHDVLAWLGY